jgi:uncharacterized cofD-like protein
MTQPAIGSTVLDPRSAVRCAAGLRVAAIGGGTGMPNVLRGLRALLYAGVRTADATAADRLVAIVTTTDDGGSSGRLRREFGIVPPGDIRNCLAALAEDQSMLTALFQFRFEAGDGLDGHALGNLMIAALTEVTGDFTKAVDIAARVVGAQGRVVPATDAPVTLSAELLDGRTVMGETAIVAAGCGIRRLSLCPAEPRAVDSALDALRRADVIVAGPGSLFTSILPPLLMPDMIEAIRLAEAARVFVLNLMTEPAETDEFDAARHIEVLAEHLGFQPFAHVIFNTAPIPEHLAAAYASRESTPLIASARDIAVMREMGLQPLGAPLASEGPIGRIRHHPGRLAAAIAACARSASRSAAAPSKGHD